MDIATAQLVTKFLLAAWALLSSAEWLINRALFRSDGPLSWEVLRLRPGLVRANGVHTVVYSSPALLVVIAARATAGIALLVPFSAWLDAAAAGTIFLSCMYLARRAVFGGDGADQMGMVVALGLTITSAGIALGDRALAFVGVFAIAAQATLAYFIAGAAKLFSAAWRSGHAMPRVMSTRTFGTPLAARIATTCPRFSHGLCWFVIVTETLFPLVFFVPPNVAIVALACYALFHVSNAYFMGLNGFVWSFLATYPSVMVMNAAARSALGWQ